MEMINCLQIISINKLRLIIQDKQIDKEILRYTLMKTKKLNSNKNNSLHNNSILNKDHKQLKIKDITQVIKTLIIIIIKSKRMYKMTS